MIEATSSALENNLLIVGAIVNAEADLKIR